MEESGPATQSGSSPSAFTLADARVLKALSPAVRDGESGEASAGLPLARMRVVRELLRTREGQGAAFDAEETTCFIPS